MKKIFRITTILLVFSIILSCLTVGAKTKEDKVNVTDKKTESITISDYSGYIAEYGYKLSKKDVEANLSATDGSISDLNGKKAILLKSENYAVYEVTVPEDAAYNINVFFANVKESVEEYHIALSIDGKLVFDCRSPMEIA